MGSLGEKFAGSKARLARAQLKLNTDTHNRNMYDRKMHEDQQLVAKLEQSIQRGGFLKRMKRGFRRKAPKEAPPGAHAHSSSGHRPETHEHHEHHHHAHQSHHHTSGPHSNGDGGAAHGMQVQPLPSATGAPMVAQMVASPSISSTVSQLVPGVAPRERRVRTDIGAEIAAATSGASEDPCTRADRNDFSPITYQSLGLNHGVHKEPLEDGIPTGEIEVSKDLHAATTKFPMPSKNKQEPGLNLYQWYHRTIPPGEEVKSSFQTTVGGKKYNEQIESLRQQWRDTLVKESTKWIKSPKTETGPTAHELLLWGDYLHQEEINHIQIVHDAYEFPRPFEVGMPGQNGIEGEVGIPCKKNPNAAWSGGDEYVLFLKGGSKSTDPVHLEGFDTHWNAGRLWHLKTLLDYSNGTSSNKFIALCSTQHQNGYTYVLTFFRPYPLKVMAHYAFIKECQTASKRCHTRARGLMAYAIASYIKDAVPRKEAITRIAPMLNLQYMSLSRLCHWVLRKDFLNEQTHGGDQDITATNDASLMFINSVHGTYKSIYALLTESLKSNPYLPDQMDEFSFISPLYDTKGPTQGFLYWATENHEIRSAWHTSDMLCKGYGINPGMFRPYVVGALRSWQWLNCVEHLDAPYGTNATQIAHALLEVDRAITADVKKEGSGYAHLKAMTTSRAFPVDSSNDPSEAEIRVFESANETDTLMKELAAYLRVDDEQETMMTSLRDYWLQAILDLGDGAQPSQRAYFFTRIQSLFDLYSPVAPRYAITSTTPSVDISVYAPTKLSSARCFFPFPDTDDGLKGTITDTQLIEWATGESTGFTNGFGPYELTHYCPYAARITWYELIRLNGILDATEDIKTDIVALAGDQTGRAGPLSFCMRKLKETEKELAFAYPIAVEITLELM